MICSDCATAIDGMNSYPWQLTAEDVVWFMSLHCDRPGCTCQHRLLPPRQSAARMSAAAPVVGDGSQP